MFQSFWRWVRQQSRRIYVRVILVAVMNVVALGVALLAGPLIPDGAADLVGAEAVDAILSVIASSMLAVVTFSLTIMVTGFSRAEGQWTPRAHSLLRQDRVTHSVLATFLGAYVYALIAMILRAADLFGERGLVVLFFTTVAVALWIVVTIIRWITHLDAYGGLTYTANRIEERAEEAIAAFARRPAQGARILAPGADIPANGVAVVAERGGHVEQIYETALQERATRLEAEIYVLLTVGSFVQQGDVLARVVGARAMDDQSATAIRRAIPVGDARTFEMDPAHTVSVLAEVAIRALSPGVNDPNTAVDMVYRLARVLGRVAREEPEASVRCDRVWMPTVPLARLFDVSFAAVGRNAATAIEVHLAIQDALGSLTRLGHDALAAEARATAADHARRAREMLGDPADRARLQEATVSRASAP